MNIFQLTNDQQRASDLVLDFCKTADENSKPFVFAGYAGTGKTTTVKEITSRLDALHIPYVQLSPTHRACKILTMSSGNETSTIHSALYKPITSVANSPSSSVVVCQHFEDEIVSGAKVYDEDTGQPYLKIFAYTPKGGNYRESSHWYDDSIRKANAYMKKKKLTAEDGYFLMIDPIIEDVHFEKRTPKEVYRRFGNAVLIIDESSMIKHDMQLHIASLYNPVVFIGDGAQLPPVYGPHETVPKFHMTDKPDFELTEIMRSANSTGIAEVGHDIRNRKSLKSSYGNGVEVHTVINPGSLYGMNKGLITGVVQHAINSFDGITDVQFIACTNKSVNLINDIARDEIGFTSIDYNNFNVVVPRPGERLISLGRDQSNGIVKSEMLTVISVDSADVRSTMVKGSNKDFVFEASGTFLTEQGEEVDLLFSIIPSANTKASPGTLKMAYAYAITTHKAQGSSFAKCVWIDDTVMQQKDNLIKYAYTGATRAEERLLLVVNGG